MKKVLLLFLLLLWGCQSGSSSYVPPAEPAETAPPAVTETPIPAEDTEAFLPDLETFSVDMSAYTGMKASDHHFLGTSPGELLRCIEEGGTAVFFLGSESCSACQAMTSLVEQAAKEENVYIAYIDPYDKQHYDFDETLNELEAALDPWLRHGNDGEALLFFPHVLAVRGGEIVASVIGQSEDYDGSFEKANERIDLYRSLMAEVRKDEK